MTPSFEVWLALGVVGFYLLDSAMLLYANELVYLHRAGRWSFSVAPSHWQMLGRYLYLPGPLAPEQGLFRLCWSASASAPAPQQRGEGLQHFLAAVDSLRHLMTLLWALVLVGLPATLLLFGTGAAFLLLVALAYATIVTLLWQIHRQRAVLGLNGRRFFRLAFDALACAPLALNLIRKITLQYPLAQEPIRFARERFDAATYAQLVEQLSRWIAAELECEDQESPRYRALRDYQQTLTRSVS